MREKYYSDDVVYFISYAKLSHSIPAGKLLDHVGIGLVINKANGIIEDISCTLLTDEAKFFLKDIIVGYNIHDNDINKLLSLISSKYHGFSQKAVCVAVQGAYERYIQWTNE